MKYQKSQGVGGQWVNKKELHQAGADRGLPCKIVSETKPFPSQFKDDDGNPTTQDVAKVKFEKDSEPVNVSLNRPTINALVEAFGEDSVNWQGKALTAMTEKTNVGGRRGIALYLIPEGYELSEDANGYVVILKTDGEKVDAVGDDIVDA